MSVLAWIVLVWCAAMSVLMLVMLCLCMASGKAERTVERWEEEL